MMFYRNRLKTFTSWPFSSENGDTCSAESMAGAGFYSISKKRNDTSVKCFCCFKELDGWEEMDNPWEEHKRHQTNCTFIMLDKTEQKWTLGDYIELQQRMSIKYLVSTFIRYVLVVVSEKHYISFLSFLTFLILYKQRKYCFLSAEILFNYFFVCLFFFLTFQDEL
ncbi:hypothetical protein WDU94_005108 [Cyamophila willieti]